MSDEKRILAVGKVHGDFVSLRISSRQEQRPVNESHLLTDAEIEEEADDYEGDYEDRGYHRSGAW